MENTVKKSQKYPHIASNFNAYVITNNQTNFQYRSINIFSHRASYSQRFTCKTSKFGPFCKTEMFTFYTIAALGFTAD